MGMRTSRKIMFLFWGPEGHFPCLAWANDRCAVSGVGFYCVQCTLDGCWSERSVQDKVQVDARGRAGRCHKWHIPQTPCDTITSPRAWFASARHDTRDAAVKQLPVTQYRFRRRVEVNDAIRYRPKSPSALAASLHAWLALTSRSSDCCDVTMTAQLQVNSSIE